MASAMGQLSYQGTFIYEHGEETETMRITHVKDGKGVRERLYSLNGPMREVIRDGNGMRCALGSAEKPDMLDTLNDSLFPVIPVQELTQARNRYLFELGRKARFAGFIGQRLSILPRDEFRYGYDLWLEQESGLLLRWVLYDSNREELARLMFTDLRVGEDVDASELDSSTPPEQFVGVAAKQPDQSGTEPVAPMSPPEGMPPGFQLVARGQRPEGSDEPFEHLVFSDGLTSISVYIESDDPADGVSQGLSRMGTTNAYTLTRSGRQVTSIGEVPAATVKATSQAFIGTPGQGR
jgi:sigma-E factor negative regulatory protein RseB